MAIPELDSRGLLPPGVHCCTLQEAEARFAVGPYRESLWHSVMKWLKIEVQQQGVLLPLLIGGSFFSDKPNPGDIEIAIDLDGATAAQTGAAIIMFTRREEWHRVYRVDYYPNMPGGNDFGSFFQYVGPKTAQTKNLNPKDKRGILRVETWTLG